MTDETVRIRRAEPTDAVALAGIGAETFVEKFGDLYRPEDLAAFLEADHSVAAYEQLLAKPAFAVWVAEEAAGGPPIAYAVAGPCGLPVENAAAGGEIKRLYARSGAQNRGVGRRLMDLMLDWLAGEGLSPVYLSVFSENDGARRFYGRYGFAKIGEYSFMVGEQADREFIYRQEPRSEYAG